MEPVIRLLEFLKSLHRRTYIVLAVGILCGSSLLIERLPKDMIGGVLFLTAGFFMLGYALEGMEDCLDELASRRRPNSPRSFSALRVRLMWDHQIQFYGFYGAKLHRWQLVLAEGGTLRGLDPIACVRDRIDDLGVTSALDLIRCGRQHQREGAEDEMLVPLLVIFRRSPAGLIFSPRLPPTLNSLNGARIAVPGKNDPTVRELEALCAMQSLKLGQLIAPEASESIFDPTWPLEEGEASFRLAYGFNEGVLARAGGAFEFVYLHKLFDAPWLYGDVLFTRKGLWDAWSAHCRQLAASLREEYTLSGTQHGTVWGRLAGVPGYAQVQQRRFDAAPIPVDARKNAVKELSECVGTNASGEGLCGSLEDWERLESLVNGGHGGTEYCTMLREAGVFSASRSTAV